MMKIIWVTTALNNVDQIAEYISGNNPQAARRIVAKIHDAVRELTRQPYMGRAGRVEGTRELVLTGIPYFIVYRIAGNSIEIIRILHGAQQWPTQPLGED